MRESLFWMTVNLSYSDYHFWDCQCHTPIGRSRDSVRNVTVDDAKLLASGLHALITSSSNFAANLNDSFRFIFKPLHFIFYNPIYRRTGRNDRPRTIFVYKTFNKFLVSGRELDFEIFSVIFQNRRNYLFYIRLFHFFFFYFWEPRHFFHLLVYKLSLQTVQNSHYLVTA